MEELAPGLLRWTSCHEHWEEDVGSVAVETDDGLVQTAGARELERVLGLIRRRRGGA